MAGPLIIIMDVKETTITTPAATPLFKLVLGAMTQ
jgi:hypothetical protein